MNSNNTKAIHTPKSNNQCIQFEHKLKATKNLIGGFSKELKLKSSTQDLKDKEKSNRKKEEIMTKRVSNLFKSFY